MKRELNWFLTLAMIAVPAWLLLWMYNDTLGFFVTIVCGAILVAQLRRVFFRRLRRSFEETDPAELVGVLAWLGGGVLLVKSGYLALGTVALCGLVIALGAKQIRRISGGDLPAGDETHPVDTNARRRRRKRITELNSLIAKIRRRSQAKDNRVARRCQKRGT